MQPTCYVSDFLLRLNTRQSYPRKNEQSSVSTPQSITPTRKYRIMLIR